MNHNINLSTRVSLLNCLVRSQLTYGCQTWTLTANQKDKVNSTYALMLRKMIRNGFRRKEDQWSYVWTNEAILKLCRTETVKIFVSCQQRKYLAHLIRCDDNSLIKRLLFNNDRNTRPGRRIDWTSNSITKEECSESVFYSRAIARKF